MTESFNDLIDAAKLASKNSYSPYSHFSVGAALLSRDGDIYTGCNVESVSFPVGICAEQSALAAAVNDGKRKFTAIAIYSESGVAPCGKCRQALAEFGDMWVICVDSKGIKKDLALSKLLPDAFNKI